MTNHGAVLAYREYSKRFGHDDTLAEKANNAILELEHELAGVSQTLTLAVGSVLEQEHRAISAEAELATLREQVRDMDEEAHLHDAKAEAELAERDEENATLQWLTREAIAATWPVRPSDETIESEYQELLSDAPRAEEGNKP